MPLQNNPRGAYNRDALTAALLNLLHDNGMINEIAAELLTDIIEHDVRRASFATEYGRKIMRDINDEYINATTPNIPAE